MQYTLWEGYNNAQIKKENFIIAQRVDSKFEFRFGLVKFGRTIFDRFDGVYRPV